MTIDLPPINQVESGVRVPADERRGHGTETVYGGRDHRPFAHHRDRDGQRVGHGRGLSQTQHYGAGVSFSMPISAHQSIMNVND